MALYMDALHLRQQIQPGPVFRGATVVDEDDSSNSRRKQLFNQGRQCRLYATSRNKNRHSGLCVKLMLTFVAAFTVLFQCRPSVSLDAAGATASTSLGSTNAPPDRVPATVR
jgi:hypothetical protein